MMSLRTAYFATLDNDFAYVSSAGPLVDAQEKARHRARMFGACLVVERRGVELRLLETVCREGVAQLRLPFLWVHVATPTGVIVTIPVSDSPSLPVSIPVHVGVSRQLPLFPRF